MSRGRHIMSNEQKLALAQPHRALAVWMCRFVPGTDFRMGSGKLTDWRMESQQRGQVNIITGVQGQGGAAQVPVTHGTARPAACVQAPTKPPVRPSRPCPRRRCKAKTAIPSGATAGRATPGTSSVRLARARHPLESLTTHPSADQRPWPGTKERTGR
jgi:hypothetical protein